VSSFLGNRGVHFAVWIGLGTASVLAAPAACLYPEHTFENEPSGGGAGPSGGGPTEDCGNGVDDNGDGLVDCGDPACGAFACVPELTAGWTGYFALFEGAPGADPGCSGGFTATTPPPFVGNDGLSAPPAACSCSCGPAAEQECDPLDTITININDAACGSPDASCGGSLTPPPDWTGVCKGDGAFRGGQLTCGPTANDTCSAATGMPCNVSVTVAALAATGGHCSPVIDVQKPSLTWAKLGRACAAADTRGKGCNVGQVCLPKPDALFGSGVCIAKDGENSCPPGAYTSQHVFYTEAADTRDCTGCSCSAPSGGTCPTTVSLYADLTQDTCTMKVAEVPAGSCVALGNNPTVAGRSASAPGAPTGATCIASTATPKGDAKGVNPRTFCCIP
jgi:hypothetical protein